MSTISGGREGGERREKKGSGVKGREGEGKEGKGRGRKGRGREGEGSHRIAIAQSGSACLPNTYPVFSGPGADTAHCQLHGGVPERHQWQNQHLLQSLLVCTLGWSHTFIS